MAMTKRETPAVKLTPPRDMPKEAKNAWKMAVDYLPEGYITPENLSVLERWARNYAMYRQLSALIEQCGILDEEGKESGHFKAFIKLQAQLGWCEKQLGFTPAARSAVRAGLVEEKHEDDNPFDSF